MKKPTEVNIFGVTYKITYCNKVTDVDIHERKACWGQIDYWTRTIRIFDGGQPVEDIWQTIFHEVLHGITVELHLDKFSADDNHDDLDILSIALADVLIRNGWLAK